MKQFNRIVLSLTLAMGVVLFWSLISRTDWAASVSLLGIGDNFTNALQPLVKVAAVTTVFVTGVRLIQLAFRAVKKPRPRVARSSARTAA